MQTTYLKISTWNYSCDNRYHHICRPCGPQSRRQTIDSWPILINVIYVLREGRRRHTSLHPDGFFNRFVDSSNRLTRSEIGLCKRGGPHGRGCSRNLNITTMCVLRLCYSLASVCKHTTPIVTLTHDSSNPQSTSCRLGPTRGQRPRAQTPPLAAAGWWTAPHGPCVFPTPRARRTRVLIETFWTPTRCASAAAVRRRPKRSASLLSLGDRVLLTATLARSGSFAERCWRRRRTSA